MPWMGLCCSESGCAAGPGQLSLSWGHSAELAWVQTWCAGSRSARLAKAGEPCFPDSPPLSDFGLKPDVRGTCVRFGR